MPAPFSCPLRSRRSVPGRPPGSFLANTDKFRSRLLSTMRKGVICNRKSPSHREGDTLTPHGEERGAWWGGWYAPAAVIILYPSQLPPRPNASGRRQMGPAAHGPGLPGNYKTIPPAPGASNAVAALSLTAYYKKTGRSGGRLCCPDTRQGACAQGRKHRRAPVAWKCFLDASARPRDADRAAIRGTYLGKKHCPGSRVQGSGEEERRGRGTAWEGSSDRSMHDPR